MLIVFKSNFQTSKDEDFGFTVGGGIESPLDPNDLSIFVTEVMQDGIAAGKLRLVIIHLGPVHTALFRL